METEKRKNCRFTIKNDVFAALGHHYITVGKINDISQGGLSFTYWSNEELFSETSYALDIFHQFSGLHMSNLPCKVAYDIPSRPHYPNPTMTLSIMSKKCGVQFGELTQDQSIQLTSFIKNISSGIAPYSA